jgi:hypothetical protein
MLSGWSVNTILGNPQQTAPTYRKQFQQMRLW